MALYGRRYTVKATDPTDPIDFKCNSCGYKARMIAVGEGTGIGWSPYMLNDEGASKYAQSAARLNARENAHTTRSRAIGLALCPKCLKRDPKGERKFRNRTIIYMIIVFAICAGGGWFYAVRYNETFFALLGAMSAVIFSFVVWSSRSKILYSVSRQVHFLPKEEDVLETKKKKGGRSSSAGPS